MSFQQEYVRCGKPGCKKCRGNGPGHGPYWYEYSRDPRTGKVKSRYWGKNHPEDEARKRQGESPKNKDAEKPHAHDAIFNRKTASMKIALAIFGIEKLPSKTELVRTYRALSTKHHPDLFKSDTEKRRQHTVMARINAAFQYLKDMVK